MRKISIGWFKPAAKLSTATVIFKTLKGKIPDFSKGQIKKCHKNCKGWVQAEKILFIAFVSTEEREVSHILFKIGDIKKEDALKNAKHICVTQGLLSTVFQHKH